MVKVIKKTTIIYDGYEIEEVQIKTRVTIHVPIALIERVKNAVYWEPGLTVAGLCEQALLQEIRDLENQRGGAYPRRRSPLRGGRPIR